MNFVTKSSVNFIILGVVCINSYANNDSFERLLRKKVLENGFKSTASLYQNPDEKLVPFGKVIFESNKGLSLNGDISCKTCHLNEHGSADGIANAAAIGGKGESSERLLSGAKQLPRNTLAFWGRGAKEFNVFFWDGKVDFSNNQKKSQFGNKYPSTDPFITAIHLPVVEIREMLDEDRFVEMNKVENVDNSKKIYSAISQNLKRVEKEASAGIAKTLNKSVDDLQFIDYARSLAAFIRSEFKLKPTKLEKFILNNEKLSGEEVRGGVIFYGKGACSTCHNGPHFSDFKFHAVPFPQLGFGKNGFGVDYGRYNVSFNPQELYKFRTPPLYNVEKTAPYGHSGSVKSLESSVIAHFDPLRLHDYSKLSALDRHEFAKRLLFNDALPRVSYLSDNEVRQVVSFLKTLSFD